MSFAKAIHHATPVIDKFAAVIGSGTALWISHADSIVAIIVGVLTIAMLIPRVIIAWRALLLKRGEIPVERVVDPKELERRLEESD